MKLEPIVSLRMRPAPATGPARIVVCALETYSKIGGLQNFNRRVIANLAQRALVRGEPPPHVFLLRDQGAAIPSTAGIEITGIHSRFRFFLSALRASVTRANLLIIGHRNLLPVAALVRCLRPSLPILLFVHGEEVWNEPRRHTQRRWYESWFLRAVSQIASVSSFTAETMAREFDVPSAKFTLLPNAVDPLDFSPHVATHEPATILTVARLSLGDREKNVDQMIRAVATLRQSLPHLRYTSSAMGRCGPSSRRSQAISVSATS
jgi:phosphatidylinositol alpha-1,6-mannosyltransferase